MNTPICRACGCSLVRLGISHDNATTHTHAGKQHIFCCPGCVETFSTNPDRYLKETSDLIVCPTCLAEKPIDRSQSIEYDRHTINFCHCPRCVELFKENPKFYLGRLAGSIPNQGIHDHNGCCLN